MRLANRFREIDKNRVWMDHQFCILCGSNENCSLHHIQGTSSKSILNSCMLCYKHHKEADGHNVSDGQFQAKLLQLTIKQVLKTNYELNSEDIAFYQQNRLLYDLLL